MVAEAEEEICSSARHRGTKCAEAREAFELERGVSCRSGDHWRRTELNFGSREPFDDLHGSTAFRAAPKTGRVFGEGSVLLGLRLLYRAEQVKAERQESGPLAIGQEAEVTDAHETLGEQVQQEASQELVDR